MSYEVIQKVGRHQYIYLAEGYRPLFSGKLSFYSAFKSSALLTELCPIQMGTMPNVSK